MIIPAFIFKSDNQAKKPTVGIIEKIEKNSEILKLLLS